MISSIEFMARSLTSIRSAGIFIYFLLYDFWSFPRSCSHIFA